MKLKLAVFATSLFLANNTFANQLSCQIINLASNHIVDQSICDFPSNNRPILIILGVGELTGTIKDTVGSTETERNLSLQFSYGFPGGPNSNGIGTSFAHYNRDQEITNRPLAEVEMTDPRFPTVYSLQCTLIN